MPIVTENASPETVIEEFSMRLEQSGLSKFVEIDLTVDGAVISLDRIFSKTPSEGYATKAIELLLSLCDECHKDIKVTAHPLDDRTLKGRLEEWCVRRGFVKIDGINSAMRRSFRR